MKRRALLQLLGATATTSTAWPLRLNAQQRSQARTGRDIRLTGGYTSRKGRFSPGAARPRLRRGARHFICLPDIKRIPASTAAALEFVRQKPEVIVSGGGVANVRALMEVTSTIPIVMVTANDAVETGLVTTLARPGGNVTGLSYQNSELSTKRLQLLHETLPLARRIAVFLDPTQGDRDATDAAGRALGLELRFVEISGPDAFDGAFETAAKWGAEALSTGAGRIVSPNREKFVAFAARYWLPAMYHQSVIVHAGGLMSYGPNFPDLYRRAAIYVDKILKGSKPADLPVEQPTRFEPVVNLGTAKALGLIVPQTILALADEVIE